MHDPILDYLEEYLRDSGDPSIPRQFHAHLASCESCKAELRDLADQTPLLRALRPPMETEPASGFYARVMTRIDDRTADSFWGAFLERGFGKRLAFACGALALLMGTYIVSTEPSDHFASPTGVVSTRDSTVTFGEGNVQPRQRDAVLASFATFRE